MTKILLIEDDKEIIQLIAEYINLADNTAETFQCLSGKEAICIINKNKFDLIICDRNLENGYTGENIFESNLENNTPFLLLSGNIDGFIQNNPNFLLQNRQNRIMEKPFNFKEFQKYIQSFKEN